MNPFDSSNKPLCRFGLVNKFLKVLLITSLLLASSFPVLAETLSGRVVKVTDGDTITVLDASKQQHKIRLNGIDAPELNQAYGQASRKHLAGIVAGKLVTVEWHKRDKYRRIVGKVLLDSQDVCLEQIRAGMAWHYKKYQEEQTPEDRVSYGRVENEARAAHLGLWKDANPVPPWDWRHSIKN